MEPMSLYVAEFFGTALLLLLGNGINMTLSLKDSYAKGGGWIVTCIGWGFSVMMGIFAVGWISGAHLNPAVTIGLAANGMFPWSQVPGYILAQLLGAFCGAVLAYSAYKRQMDSEDDIGTKLGVFATGPAIPDTLWNLVTEILGTFVLLLGICAINQQVNEVAPGMAPFFVGMLVAVIGMALGGATGFAINPARDLGPRIAHAVLPIKGKGDSNWGYSWIPIVGPIIGGILGVGIFNFFLKIVG